MLPTAPVELTDEETSLGKPYEKLSPEEVEQVLRALPPHLIHLNGIKASKRGGG